MSTREWFVELRGVRSGPLPRTSVEGLRARGLIGDETPVWRAGMDGWQPWRMAWAAAYGDETAAQRPLPPLPPTASPAATSGAVRRPPPPPPPRPAAPSLDRPPTAPQAEAPRRRPLLAVLDYLRRHWRGEFDLPWAYWINGTLLGLPIALLIVAIGAAAGTTRRPVLLLAAALGVLLLVLLTGLWQLVGIWRSSDAYVRAKGSPVWSGLAKLMCLVGLAQLGLVSWQSSQELSVLWRYGEAVGEYADFSVEAADGGRTLVVRGPIGVGFGDAVVDALDDHPLAVRLRITSEGGLVHEALLATEAVAARGMDVEVVGECSSACFALFAAGRRRIVHDGAVLLLHAIEPVVEDAARDAAGRDTVDGETAAYERALLRHRIPAPVVDRWRALRDGAAEPAPIADLLVSGAIAAVVVDGAEVPADEFFATALERIAEENPALAPTARFLRAAQRSFPVVYREALLRYRRLVLREAAPADDDESAPDYLARMFAGFANDGVHLGAWRAIARARLAEMQRLSAAGDVAACHAVDHGTDDAAIAARVDPALHDEVARWQVELAEGPAAPPIDAGAREQRRALNRLLLRRAGAPWAADFEREGSAALDRPEVGCGFGIAWYRELLALSEAEIVLVSRSVD